MNTTQIPEDFDWKTYVELHPDLQQAGIDTEEKATRHYIACGAAERRKYRKPAETYALPQPAPCKSYTFDDFLSITAALAPQLGKVPATGKHHRRKSLIIESREIDIDFTVKNTILKLGEGWSHIVYCHSTNVQKISAISPEIEIHALDSLTWNEYNNLFYNAGFIDSWDCDEILIYQSDTIILKPWSDDYRYDFIGGRLPEEVNLELASFLGIAKTRLWNGGLSFRNVSLMKQALADPSFSHLKHYDQQQAPAVLGYNGILPDLLHEDVFYSTYAWLNGTCCENSDIFSLEIPAMLTDSFGVHRIYNFRDFGKFGTLECFIYHHIFVRPKQERIAAWQDNEAVLSNGIDARAAVTVLVPLYNYEQYIGKCIQSVFNQSFREIEVIIVNDCSQDDSLAEACRLMQISPFPFRIIDKPLNTGPAHTRHTGLKYASGRYVFMLDADNTIYPDCIEKHFHAAESRQADLVYAGISCIKDGKSILVNSNRDYDLQEVIRKNYIDNMALYRTETVRELGYNLHGETDTFEDWELLIRFGKTGKTIFRLDEILSEYLFHDRNSLAGSFYYHPYMEKLLHRYNLVHVYVNTYNNARMLERFITHYRERFPYCTITVYNNHSTDDTPSVCRKHYCRHILFGSRHFDDTEITRIKNHCWKGQPEAWTFILDDDEFLEISAADLEQEESSVIFFNGIEKAGEKYARNKLYGKPACFRNLEETNYTPGQHDLSPEGKQVIISRNRYHLIHQKFSDPETALERIAVLRKRIAPFTSTAGFGVHYSIDYSSYLADIEKYGVPYEEIAFAPSVSYDDYFEPSRDRYSDPGSDSCIFTICDTSRLSGALALGDSLKKYDPCARLVIFMTEDVNTVEMQKITGYEIINIYEMGLSINALRERYSNQMAFSCIFKPLGFLHLLPRFEKIIYADADICFYDDHRKIQSHFDTHDILLTLHSESYVDNDNWYSVSGIYNAGFIGIRRTANSTNFIQWWKSRIVDEGTCLLRTEKGYFYDQSWLNYVHMLFNKVLIIRDKGYNVACWNLHERKITSIGGRYMVSDEKGCVPLMFYHFSGYNYTNFSYEGVNYKWHTGVRRLAEEYRMQLYRSYAYFIRHKLPDMERKRYMSLFSPRTYMILISGRQKGGTREFCHRLADTLENACITDSLEGICPGDVILVNHFLYLDIRPQDIRNEYIVFLHDQYWFNEDLHDTGCDYHIERNCSIPPANLDFLRKARHVIANSEYTFSAYAPYLDNMYIVSPVDDQPKERELSVPPVNDRINLAILNNFTEYKGSEIFRKLFVRYPHIRFHLFGEIDCDACNVIFHGRYSSSNLQERLRSNKIHGLLFFNRFPETYCYALTKALESGLPIFYTRLGAYIERLSGIEGTYEFEPGTENLDNAERIISGLASSCLSKVTDAGQRR